MAKILTPTKDLYIDNCPVLHVNKEIEGEHPEGFDEFPNLFVMEVFDDTRRDIELPTNNNPISMNLTGNIKF